MYSRILVPVDGSEPAAAGLEEAIKLGESPAARLRLIHVVNEFILPPPSWWARLIPSSSQQMSSRSYARMEEHFSARLNRWSANMASSPNASCSKLWVVRRARRSCGMRRSGQRTLSSWVRTVGVGYDE